MAQEADLLRCSRIVVASCSGLFFFILLMKKILFFLRFRGWFHKQKFEIGISRSMDSPYPTNPLIRNWSMIANVDTTMAGAPHP